MGCIVYVCLHPRCSYLPETTCEYDSLYSPRSDSSLSSHRPCDLGVCQYFFLTIQSDTISRPYSHGNKQHIKNLRASVQNPKSRQLRKSQVRVIHAIQNKSVTVDGSTIYIQFYNSRQRSEISTGQYLFLNYLY